MALITLTFPPGSFVDVQKIAGHWQVVGVNDAPVEVDVDDADDSGTISNGEWDPNFSGNGNDQGDTYLLYSGTGSLGTLASTDGTTFVLGQNVDDEMALVDNDFEAIVDGVVCFTAGTMIRCPQGDVPVEALAVGDLVITEDHGARPIRWIGRRKLGPDTFALHPHLRPVRIRAGTIAPGVPTHDLLVSPEHRLRLDSFRGEALFGSRQVLAAARALISDSSVTVDHGARNVEYIHIMFDDHEIIHGNGMPSESFHATESGLKNMTPSARTEILTLFPEIRTAPQSLARPARVVISELEARQLSIG